VLKTGMTIEIVGLSVMAAMAIRMSPRSASDKVSFSAIQFAYRSAD
jgi:hypothetical protein